MDSKAWNEITPAPALDLGKWEKVSDRSFVPQARQRSRKAKQKQTNAQPEEHSNWTWSWDQERHQPSARTRSVSAKQKKGKGKGKGKKSQRDAEEQTSYTTPSFAPPPPWNHAEPAAKEEPIAIGHAEAVELAEAVRAAHPDPGDLTESVRKALSKIETTNTANLTDEMHRTADALKQARRDLQTLKDASIRHKNSWLTHLRNLMESLAKQFEAYDEQQKVYVTKISEAHTNINKARKVMQRLNAQAAIKEIPPMVIEETTASESAGDRDSEEAATRTQVTELLQKCVNKATNQVPIDVPSDDDMLPSTKRQRSQEPPMAAGVLAPGENSLPSM
eukprot:s283_g6.t1